jgi:hypothetical protein
MTERKSRVGWVWLVIVLLVATLVLGILGLFDAQNVQPPSGRFTLSGAELMHLRLSWSNHSVFARKNAREASMLSAAARLPAKPVYVETAIRFRGDVPPTALYAICYDSRGVATLCRTDGTVIHLPAGEAVYNLKVTVIWPDAQASYVLRLQTVARGNSSNTLG